MWVAGMTFGYGYGFLLIMSGVAIGVSLPFFIGSLFHHKIQVSILLNALLYIVIHSSTLIVALRSGSSSACLCVCAYGIQVFICSNTIQLFSIIV